MWAIKAFEHAEIYFNVSSSLRKYKSYAVLYLERKIISIQNLKATLISDIMLGGHSHSKADSP